MEGLSYTTVIELAEPLAGRRGSTLWIVLMPGGLYDGNRCTRTFPVRTIRRIATAENFRVQTPFVTLSTPLMALSAGKALFIETELTYVPDTPKGRTMRQETRFHILVICFSTQCADAIGLFTLLQPLRNMVRPLFNRMKRVRLPLPAASAMAKTNVNRRMWTAGPKNWLYINAMSPNFDLAKRGMSGLWPDWQLQVGWCTSANSGYAMFKLGHELGGKPARLIFDWIVTGGQSPSELFWCIYFNEEWEPLQNNIGAYRHMRKSADDAFFFQKAIALKRVRDLEDLEWEKAVFSNLDAVTRCWKKYRIFGWCVGHYKLAIVRPETAAGALCITGLTLGTKMPHGGEYLAVAREVAEAFCKRHFQTGWKHAAARWTYPARTIPRRRRHCLKARLRFAMSPAIVGTSATLWRPCRFCIPGSSPIMPRSQKEGFCCKDSIQNVRDNLVHAKNHHNGPSFWTHCGGTLASLYRYTGDILALSLLEDGRQRAATVIRLIE